MTYDKTRKPSQERSIATREKIIDAGFELICNDGYYNTDTAKIAKKAGVSTGIVYQYFKDKRDILLTALDKYSDEVFEPMLSIAPDSFTKEDLPKMLKDLINYFISYNKISAKAHQEITAIAHYDKEVDIYFQEKKVEIIDKASNILINNGFNPPNIKERVYIVAELVDHLCNEIIYHKRKDSTLNYDIMIDIVVNEIINILT